MDLRRKAIPPEQTRVEVDFLEAEIECLLNQAGLRAIKLIESTDEQPFKLGSPRLILTVEEL